MLDRNGETARDHARADLEEATGVRRGHDVGTRRGDALDLAREETARHAGLGQVVGTRAPAADVGILQLDEPHAGDRREEGTHGHPHALAVGEVAGIVHRDATGKRMDGWREPQVGEELERVVCPARQLADPGLVDEQVIVLADERAAAGCRRHHPVGGPDGKRRRRVTSEPPRSGSVAEMESERAAAALTRRHDDAHARALEKAGGRELRRREERGGRAARQQDGRPARLPRRHQLRRQAWHRAAGWHRRGDRHPRAECRRDAACEPSDPWSTTQEPERQEGQSSEARRGEQPGKRPAPPAGEARPMGLDVRARRLDE